MFKAARTLSKESASTAELGKSFYTLTVRELKKYLTTLKRTKFKTISSSINMNQTEIRKGSVMEVDLGSCSGRMLLMPN